VNNVDNILQTSFLDDSACEQHVNIQYIKRKKRKRLEINIDSAVVEANMLLLPIATVGEIKEKDVGEVIVKWVDSNSIERGIKVAVGDGFTPINIFDIKVMYALFKIYSESMPILEYNVTDTQQYAIPIETAYTPTEIARRLKYKSFSKPILTKIQDSIKKLGSATVVSVSNGAIWDSKTKTHVVMSGEEGYHILSYKMYQYGATKDKDGNHITNVVPRLHHSKIKEINYVRFDDFFYQNMCNGYFKIIPFDLFVLIRLEVTLRIFSLLEGWFCSKKPFVYFKYETLYHRIPLPDTMATKYKNREIKKACEELIELKYIVRYKIKPNEGIFFIFDSESNDDAMLTYEQTYLGLDKYIELDEVVKALLGYGISEDNIENYVTNENLSYIQALLRYFDMGIRFDRIDKNPIGFLSKGLKGSYKIDKKYYNK
jgi:hypothetical protein